ncbi:MAG: nuclear transport factor 2 family protein [Vicinamibacterales bacterium]
MRVGRAVAVVALMVASSAATWMYAEAQQRKLPALLSPADHLEILQLYGYYARDVDSGSQRAASWMYTEDGVWDVEGTRYVGAAALAKYYANVHETHKDGGLRHFATNPVVVPSEEGARGSIYMVQLSRKVKDGPISLDLFGKYEDRLVKTSKGWRFKERVWRSDTFEGDHTPVLPSPMAAVD